MKAKSAEGKTPQKAERTATGRRFSKSLLAVGRAGGSSGSQADWASITCHWHHYIIVLESGQEVSCVLNFYQDGKRWGSRSLRTRICAGPVPQHPPTICVLYLRIQPSISAA